MIRELTPGAIAFGLLLGAISGYAMKITLEGLAWGAFFLIVGIGAIEAYERWTGRNLYPYPGRRQEYE